jgi:hypothetical protein
MVSAATTTQTFSSSPPRAAVDTGCVLQRFYAHTLSHSPRQVPGSSKANRRATRCLGEIWVSDCMLQRLHTRLLPLRIRILHKLTLSLDSFFRPTASKSSSPAGLFALVYAYVVDCVPASPYAYSSSTHRFPDERKPIEATSISATSAELGLGFGLGLGLGSLSLFSSHALPFFSPPSSLSHTIPFPHVH